VASHTNTSKCAALVTHLVRPGAGMGVLDCVCMPAVSGLTHFLVHGLESRSRQDCKWFACPHLYITFSFLSDEASVEEKHLAYREAR